jgi:hypothetical protein
MTLTPSRAFRIANSQSLNQVIIGRTSSTFASGLIAGSTDSCFLASSWNLALSTPSICINYETIFTYLA